MTTSDEAANSPGTYTPGHAREKALMIVFGLVLVIAGCEPLARPVRLLLFGQSTRAEATEVLKTKQGLTDLVLKSDAQILASVETRDRSYIFWNRFHFTAPSGQEVDVEAPVGSQLKPLYPLLDEDGLPTTELVYYDAGNPKIVVFPRIFSTWFAPGMIVLVGLLATMIGSVLFYWANKPIVLPHIPPAGKPSA
jgi:hypothetical protein